MDSHSIHSMESTGVTLCSLSDMCYPLPWESDKVQNWHSFYKEKFGFLCRCFALDLSQAASSRHVSSAVFVIAASTLVFLKNINLIKKRDVMDRVSPNC